MKFQNHSQLYCVLLERAPEIGTSNQVPGVLGAEGLSSGSKVAEGATDRPNLPLRERPQHSEGREWGDSRTVAPSPASLVHPFVEIRNELKKKSGGELNSWGCGILSLPPNEPHLPLVTGWFEAFHSLAESPKLGGHGPLSMDCSVFNSGFLWVPLQSPCWARQKEKARRQNRQGHTQAPKARAISSHSQGASSLSLDIPCLLHHSLQWDTEHLTSFLSVPRQIHSHLYGEGTSLRQRVRARGRMMGSPQQTL